MFVFPSGVFASTTLFIHILYKRHALELWYTPENLQQIRTLGLMGLLAGLAGAATYIGIASSRQEGERHIFSDAFPPTRYFTEL